MSAATLGRLAPLGLAVALLALYVLERIRTRGARADLRADLAASRAYGDERHAAAQWLGRECKALQAELEAAGGPAWGARDEASRLAVELATTRTDNVALMVRAQAAETAANAWATAARAYFPSGMTFDPTNPADALSMCVQQARRDAVAELPAPLDVDTFTREHKDSLAALSERAQSAEGRLVDEHARHRETRETADQLRARLVEATAELTAIRDALRAVGVYRSDEAGDDGSEWVVVLAEDLPVGTLEEALRRILDAGEHRATQAEAARAAMADELARVRDAAEAHRLHIPEDALACAVDGAAPGAMVNEAVRDEREAQELAGGVIRAHKLLADLCNTAVRSKRERVKVPTYLLGLVLTYVVMAAGIVAERHRPTMPRVVH